MSKASADGAAVDTPQLQQIPLKKIKRSPYNPRKVSSKRILRRRKPGPTVF